MRKDAGHAEQRRIGRSQSEVRADGLDPDSQRHANSIQEVAGDGPVDDDERGKGGGDHHGDGGRSGPQRDRDRRRDKNREGRKRDQVVIGFQCQHKGREHAAGERGGGHEVDAVILVRRPEQETRDDEDGGESKASREKKGVSGYRRRALVVDPDEAPEQTERHGGNREPAPQPRPRQREGGGRDDDQIDVSTQ